jgi:hypothetical protein
MVRIAYLGYMVEINQITDLYQLQKPKLYYDIELNRREIMIYPIQYNAMIGVSHVVVNDIASLSDNIFTSILKDSDAVIAKEKVIWIGEPIKIDFPFHTAGDQQ